MTAAVLASDGLGRALASPHGNGRRLLTTIVAALIFHEALIALSLRLSPRQTPPVATRLPPTQFIDIQPPLPDPPPVEEPKVAEVAHRSAPALRPTKSVAPPPPAQAAAVLAAKEPADAPVDLSDSIVMGSGDTYVGGASSATGTGSRAPATALPASKSGGDRLVLAKAAAVGPDQSRHARLAEGGAWTCPFPTEADDAQIDHAVVTLRIAVDVTGRPGDVGIVSDPGNGFGREARVCALAKRYEPALDATGVTVSGSATIKVRFDR